MGAKKRGGLADDDDVNLLINHPKLASHLFDHWKRYKEIADWWKNLVEVNGLQDSTERNAIKTEHNIIKHVAIEIGQTNPETRVIKLATSENLDDRLVTELFAKICYQSKLSPDKDFPNELKKFFEEEN